MATDGLNLSLEIDGKRQANAAKGLNRLGKKLGVTFQELTPIAKKEMLAILGSVREAMIQRHNTPWRAGQKLPEGARKGKLAKRSGGVKGIKVLVKGGTDSVTGWIQVPFPLSVHEKGAIVKKRKKLLAIPLPEALDSRGVPKKSGPRDWPNTFVAKSKKGSLLIFQRRGAKIIPLYVLKERVKIPARLGLGVTMATAAPLFVDRMFDTALRKLRATQAGV